MSFHIKKNNSRFGTLYYVGNLQFHQNRDKRFIYETEEEANHDSNQIRGTVVEETE